MSKWVKYFAGYTKIAPRRETGGGISVPRAPNYGSELRTRVLSTSL